MPGVIIPRKTVHELHRLIEDSSATVKVGVSPAKVRFEIGSVTLTSKLIDGTFPDYGRVIPQGNDKEMKVSNAEFMGAVDRVSTIASERGRAVKLNIKPDKLILSVNNPEGGSATEEIGVEYAATPARDRLQCALSARHRRPAAGRARLLQARRSGLAHHGQRPERRVGALRADADAGVAQWGDAPARVQRSRGGAAAARLWVERLTLTNFRNYAHLALEAGPEPQVLIGANGAGKTNLSRPSPCWRRARACAARPIRIWRARRATAAGRSPRACTRTLGAVDIGTGPRVRRQRRAPGARRGGARGANRAHQRGAGRRLGRARRVHRARLGDAGDGRALHRAGLRAPPLPRPADLVLRCRAIARGSTASSAPCSSATACSPTACAMRARFEGLELLMAETGTAIAAARAEAVAALAVDHGRAPGARSRLRRFRRPGSPSRARSKPIWSGMPAVDVEEAYAHVLREAASATARPGARSTDRTAPISSSSTRPSRCRRGCARRASRRRCCWGSCWRTPSSSRAAATASRRSCCSTR